MSVLETIRMITRSGAALPEILQRRRNVDLMLDRCAEAHPNLTAIAYLDERVSFRELRERADQYARFFADQGIGKGDRVVLTMDNRPDFLFIFHGLQRLGAIAALINTNLTGIPLAHVVRIAEAKLFVFGSEHAAKLDALAKDIPELDLAKDVWIQQEVADAKLFGARSLNDAVDSMSNRRLPLLPFHGREHCAYIYTSGTTGLPKAAVMAHDRVTGAGTLAGHALHRVSPGQLIYICLPLYHSNALMLGWIASLATGSGIALRRKFSASEFFRDIRVFDAKSFVYVGELCRYLVNSPPEEGERNHQLHACTGNGMRPDVWETFQKRFGVPVVREIYGATEGTTTLVNLSGRPGMVGKIAPGMAVVICDLESGVPLRNANGFCEKVASGETGLLLGAINQYATFDGYLDRKASSDKVIGDVFKPGDSFFNTGDLIKLHPGRWLSFVDRVGDTFRWKGENVSTNEVGEVVNAGPGVIETNVYGVEITGCEGRAGMASIRVSETFDPNALARFVADQLPAFQRPLFIRVTTDEIEITGTFKHQKVKARKQRFDPDQVGEPLYYLAKNEYLPIDRAVFRAIESGEIRPG